MYDKSLLVGYGWHDRHDLKTQNPRYQYLHSLWYLPWEARLVRRRDVSPIESDSVLW